MLQILPMPDGLQTLLNMGTGQPPARLTDEQIREIALGLSQNRYFVATQAPTDLLPVIFMPLGFGALSDIDVSLIGNIIEEYSKAGPRGINGYPMFMSAQIVHVEDWEQITRRYEALTAAIQEALDS